MPTMRSNSTVETDLHQRAADLLDALTSQDTARIASFYADTYHGIDVGQAHVQHGPHDRVAAFEVLRQAFPDLRFSGEALVEGNRVALTWTMRGTHQGRFNHIPQTGRAVAVRGVSVLTFANGQIVEGLTIWDTAGLLRAMGLLPEL